MYELLEALYEEYNRREYVPPDPLQFLYEYDVPADREVVGLIASCLAYGRVTSILSSVGRVLSVLGKHPASVLAACDRRGIKEGLAGFVHRFANESETTRLLQGIGRVLCEYGSLERLFREGMRDSAAPAIWRGAAHFVSVLLERAELADSHLLPRPERGSACKRLCLYLRWMVRRDGVDPGGWDCLSPCDIVVPLDTHMHRIARGLGLTTRVAADGKAAREATEGFRRLCPEDPVRYDFALTRFGIRTGLSVEALLKRFR